MSEQVTHAKGVDWRSDVDVPDDAYELPDRSLAALDAAERARVWLNEHPESQFGANPPEADPPRQAASEEDIDALIAEAEALAREARTVTIA